MRYDESFIDQVQTANDIVEVISQYLPLKRAGRNLKANCPFHQEKTPSFMVQPEKQIFHCFGCSAGGNVFGFLMRYENLSFPEAVRQLAERAHIPLPKQSFRKEDGPSENEQLYEIYRLAQDYYHALFLDPVQGKPARDYFFKRGFDQKMAEELKMGWAPDAWRGLFEFLSKKGFREELLLKSSLVFRSQKGGQPYDVFRGRLLFPICNLQGKVVAFGGRALQENNPPKYLNSPENPIFHKRRELFGLYLAKKFIDHDQPRLFVVEGYFDFLGLYAKGFKAVVATLGTSLTSDHVQLLKRFAEEAIVVYDGDKAGEAASLRGLEIFLEGGMNVKVARIPSGFDPDNFVQKEGAEAFQKILSEAQDFFDYKLGVLMQRYNRWDSLGLMKITGDFLETFVKVKNPVLLDRFLRRLAGSLGIEEQSLKTELAKLKNKSAEREKKFQASLESKAGQSSLENPEELLALALAMEEPVFRETLFEELKEADFQDPALRRTFLLLRQLHQENQKAGWPQILNRIEGENFKEKFISAVSFEESSAEREKAFQDCLMKIKKRNRDRKLAELRHFIAKAEQEGNQSQLEAFAREYETLWKQKG